MIKNFIKEKGALRELEEVKPKCWINISTPFSQEELEDFAQIHDIPIDFLTDPLDIDERSRYDREDDVRLIIINTPVLNDSLAESNSGYITVPIGIILTPENIITITAFQNTILDLFVRDKVKNFDPKDEQLFVLQLLEQNVYAFLNSLKKLNLQRNMIEKELLISTKNQQLIELLKIEKSLVYFLSALSSTELLNMKMKRTDFISIGNDEDKTDLFEDIIIDTSQALQMANNYSNIHNSMMETYGSIINNNVNLVMQRLTLITIIISVPTLVASIFGMNVYLFGLEDNHYALFGILAGSVALALGIVWYFRRKSLF
jgi:magnesium transporter